MAPLRIGGLILVAAALACSGAVAPMPTSPPVALSSADGAVEVSVELPSPARVRWIAATLGPPKPTLAVTVANRTSAPLDVSNLRVHLEAVREGVSFRCATEVGPSGSRREPPTLAPAVSFVFERTLDCALPLVGTYAIRVAVSFGRGNWARPQEARAFAMRVFASKEAAPTKVEAIPGLWAAVGTAPVQFGDRRGGPGRIVIALVNGDRTPLELPRFRVALRVYRAGVSIPCEDEPIDLDAPAVLGAGASYHKPIEVSCLGLGVPGNYEIAARLRIDGDEASAIELGSWRIEVAHDPTRQITPSFR
jgi:hypothetical protein